MAFIEVKDLSKKYKMGETEIIANNEISFDIDEGELVVILGPSGAGKSTLLNMLGGMDTPTSGSIIIDGEDITDYSEKKLTRFRRDAVGFVFQFYNLIPNLTALENVEIATQVDPNSGDPKKAIIAVGLEDRMNNFPSQLSGGEQQRVAIARALAKEPKLMLCDEPTGALDYKTGKQILKLLQDTCRITGHTVIIITHNQAISGIADKVIEINDARVRRIWLNKNPMSIDEIEW